MQLPNATARNYTHTLFFYERVVLFFSVKEKKDILLYGVDALSTLCCELPFCFSDETLIVRRQLVLVNITANCSAVYEKCVPVCIA
ncbi:MAG: hypothetical protein ABIS37_15175 [Bacteroidia bacterium]